MPEISIEVNENQMHVLREFEESFGVSPEQLVYQATLGGIERAIEELQESQNGGKDDA